MNVTELLSQMAREGVQLSVEGDQLNVRAPKGVLTSTLTSHLTQYKTEILSLLRQRGIDDGGASFPPIAPAPTDRNAPFPLTDIQKAYWVGRSGALELGSGGCHYYQEFESTDLDLPRLEQAWQRLIERHDMLRAIILPDARQQILRETPQYHIEQTDLSGRNAAEQEAYLKSVRDRMSHQVFELQEWPLFDIRAERISQRLTRLHVSFDLIIADAASIFQLFREWSDLYQDPDLVLPPMELTFRDYMLAEQALRDGGRFQAAEKYWFNRISTLPPAPDLPLAKRPAAVAQAKFVRRDGKLDADRWRRLKMRAGQSGLTPSALLCAAFAEVLSAWSKNHPFTVNLTLFNRLPLHPQVKDIIGDFTSTILLEVDGSLDSFEARARRLQSQLAEDLDYMQVGGVRVLQELHRARGREGSGLMPVVFTSLLVHRLAKDQTTSPTAWLGQEVFTISQTPQVWIDHLVYEDSGTLFYNWDAVDELFPAGVLDAMFGAFEGLLQRLADEHEVWRESSLLFDQQKHSQQRATLNAKDITIPEGLLQSGFEANAVRNPKQPAVVSSQRTLTYEELARLSRRLARKLRELGARPNTLVAVVVEKGWEQIAAVLGILQSGAAYLPVDPSLPAERRLYLLEHGAVTLAITQPWLDETLEWPGQVQRLRIDSLEPATGDESPLEAVQEPRDLAYVIYTSGSTGLPKGVMIDHRGAHNTIVDMNRRFAVGAGDRVFGISSLSFDLSVYDIFGTLAAGGTIVLPEAAAEKDPAAWSELMVREQVTVWNSVPALMRMLVEYAAGRPDVLPASLRLVLLSGDWVPVSLPDQIRSVRGDVKVVSLGGATEASIWSILYPIEGVDSSWKSIPYGIPMANQSVRVLNHRLEDCPTWVTGRLFIGGVGLAKGYWRDEENSRSRFTFDPRTGERLYETGDLGRYLPDGNIEFLGREDFQVKINGHRIELGEIESALTSHPDVQAAVVAALGESRGDKRLTAYVVPKPHSSAFTDGKESPLGEIFEPVEKLEFKLSEAGLRTEGLDGPAMPLIRPELDRELSTLYTERRTHRVFAQAALGFEQISALLSCLLQMPADDSPLPKYRYPSAGSLYPVQTYLYVKPDRIKGLGPGFYYYHPKDHRLVLLSSGTFDRDIHFPENQPVFDRSAFSLFLVGELRAIAPVYGKLARDFCLLEAGYISQLLMMVAPSCGLGLCPIGGLDFERLRASLGLGESGILLHSALGGAIEKGKPLYPAVSEPDHSNSASEEQRFVSGLRSFLRKKLPEHMVPSTFTLLDRLPLTPNGKIDRKSLPVPGNISPAEATYVAPRSDLEQTLARIAQEILNIERIGVNDNFFEAGGTSLHLIQFQRRLRGVLNREIAVAAVFQHPTISLLAAFLYSGTSENAFLRQAQERARKHKSTLRRPDRPAEENGNG